MARGPWLDDREQRAWRGLMTMRARLDAAIRRSLQQQAGLSDADYGVLVHLSEAPKGRLRQLVLARALGWEKSRLSHQLRRMEARGLVERTACTTDRRGAEAVITRAGRAAIRSAAPQHAADVTAWFAQALSAEQLDDLSAISDAVVARLDELGV